MLLVELAWASAITSLYNTERKFSFPIPRRRLQQGSNQAPYWGAQHEKRRQQSQIEMKEVPPGYTKKMFHCEDNLQQAAQKDCGTSILGDFQDPTGQSHEQPGLNSVLSLLQTRAENLQLNSRCWIFVTGKDTQNREQTEHLLDDQLSHGVVQLIT